MTSRIVFLDIDGTIIDHSGEVPASAAQAIRTARRNGHRVMLASGRTPTEVDRRLVEIGFDGAILGAGAYAWVGELWTAGGWRIERLMAPAHVRRMVDGLRSVGADFVLQTRDEVRATRGGYARLEHQLAASGRLTAATREALLSHIRVSDEPDLDQVAKAVFSSDDPGCFAAVTAELGDDFSVITGTMPGLGTAGGEISPAGVTKGSTLQLLLDEVGVPVADSIAIGDNNNDLEMLRLAGVGIAMGDGTPEALAAADETTTPVGEDGIWNAFARHGLV
ncbi:HAD hydrolase family protein [Microbacterium sp. gxy059]|uniref:HAD hydrolase family protein n=1 Tax=Microbacterium sp. gxy059 TaxID=2957199 RepID=UPI003D956B7E